jgi:hypothetical protein
MFNTDPDLSKSRPGSYWHSQERVDHLAKLRAYVRARVEAIAAAQAFSETN